MNPTHITTGLTLLIFIFGFVAASSQNYLMYFLFLILTGLVSYLVPLYDHMKKKERFKCLFTMYIFGFIFGYYLNKPNWDIIGIYLCISAVRYYGEFQLINFFHHYQLQWDSFLIYHSKLYFITNIFLLLEHFITKYLIKAEYKQYHHLMLPAMVITIAAMILRIVAFFTAKSNFTHKVAYQKKQSHKLVSNGIYSVLRHPSYTGFFYYSIFSMIMIGNFVSAVLFGIILSIFFEDRIQYEESYLLDFFGQRYQEYRETTHVYIPYLPTQIKKYFPLEG